LASELSQREKHITILFNNAGILSGAFKKPSETTAAAYVKAYFDEITQTDFNDVINTNSIGPYWLTFAFLPLLERWKSEDNVLSKKFVPQVVMTSSMNGWTKACWLHLDISCGLRLCRIQTLGVDRSRTYSRRVLSAKQPRAWHMN
jgi:NAD(P)-dependent dehydrogenase (short-subunit alcohol dehydrogenase family)